MKIVKIGTNDYEMIVTFPILMKVQAATGLPFRSLLNALVQMDLMALCQVAGVCLHDNGKAIGEKRARAIVEEEMAQTSLMEVFRVISDDFIEQAKAAGVFPQDSEGKLMATAL